MISFIRSLFNRPTAHQLQVERVLLGAQRIRIYRNIKGPEFLLLAAKLFVQAARFDDVRIARSEVSE